MYYHIITEPNLRYNMVHHLITSNSMSNLQLNVLTHVYIFPTSLYLRLRIYRLTFHDSINYIEDLWFSSRNLRHTSMTIFLNQLLDTYISKSMIYKTIISQGGLKPNLHAPKCPNTTYSSMKPVQLPNSENVDKIHMK